MGANCAGARTTFVILIIIAPPSLSAQPRGPTARGWYGDFQTLNTQRMECATTQNMSWRLPKHLRPWSSSTVVQRSRTKRLVQSCARRASQTHNGVHDLTRTCTLQSTSKAHRLPARTMAAASPRLSCHTTRALALPCTQHATAHTIAEVKTSAHRRHACCVGCVHWHD
jgi:hypothetical protein